MIKIENVEAYDWGAAIRGARNPMNSWDKSDSKFYPNYFEIGPNDLRLLKNLAAAGPDHGKFMRMISVSFDITAPLYYLKEFDTYKVGTTVNSCSTMHKIHAKPFTMADFSTEHLHDAEKNALQIIIGRLNYNRDQFLATNDKCYWWQMIQLLPSSYNQRRTVYLNYAVLKTMYHARKAHKLDEWRDFCAWVETLPYAKELIVGE